MAHSRMKHISLIFVLLCICLANSGLAQVRRVEPKFPDISGYSTLLCDFHTHTVFSDGHVWPTIRVMEAWLEGLDGVAITDHIEVRRHDEVLKDHNRSVEIARPEAEDRNLLLFKGTEITKKMPPGHFNALFHSDTDPVVHDDGLKSIEAAVKQNAFVFWNHPGWRQKGQVPIWHPEHTTIFDNGWMHGMEIVNEGNYYPLAHAWCIEKNITMLGNSDIHTLIQFTAENVDSGHRSMTLVFVKESTTEGVKEALFDRRTVVFDHQTLYGLGDTYLKPLYDASVEVLTKSVTVTGTGGASVQLRNKSDIPILLEARGTVDDLTIPEKVKLYPDAVVILELKGTRKDLAANRSVRLPYTVTNMRPAPDSGLAVDIPVKVRFEKE